MGGSVALPDGEDDGRIFPRGEGDKVLHQGGADAPTPGLRDGRDGQLRCLGVSDLETAVLAPEPEPGSADRPAVVREGDDAEVPGSAPSVNVGAERRVLSGEGDGLG